MFGAFWLLGYRFSPRLADLGDARLWRLDRSADYGVLNSLARNRINRELIARNWDDLLRLAGSLKMSTVGAVELLRSLQGGGRVSTLGRALTELGRGPKTLHLLSYFDDEDHRRYIGRHLTRHESGHKLAREPIPTAGATVCNAAITYVQNAVGSLSLWSSESQAVKRSRCAADASQAARSVVLPKPAGAETSVSRASMPRLRRSLSRGRGTVAPRRRGTYSLV